MAELTVLMPVYNGEAFLADCMASILNQTYRDFVFLIIDDASTDRSKEIVRSFNDPRIQLVELPEHAGQISAMNKGLTMIDTPLVARMDADDISKPQRLARQVAFLKGHPNVGLCGTFATTFGGQKRRRWSYPCEPSDIKVKLLFECSFVHSSTVIRRDFLEKYDLKYNKSLEHSYDWELWQRAARHFDLANIPQYLVEYRIHEQSVSARTLALQGPAAEILDDASLALLNLHGHPLRKIHRDVALETFKAKGRDREFLHQVKEWFDALVEANRIYGVYEEEALMSFLKKRMFVVLTKNTRHWSTAVKYFFAEGLFRYVGWIWSLKFMIKIGLSALKVYAME